MYVLQLMRELGHDIVCPFAILIDNEATELLTKKMGATKRTEHFLRWMHYLRWCIYHGYAVVYSIHDPDQRADIMTKVVGPDKFHFCAKFLLDEYK